MPNAHLSIINFDEGFQLSDSQKATLGEKRVDIHGNIWSHTQFHEVGIKPGHWVRTAMHSDEIGAIGTSANVTATRAQAIGTTRLQARRKFGSGTVKKNLRGAVGNIYDGDGEGQTFYVNSVVDSNTLDITLISTADGFPEHDNPGWAIALTTSSKFRLTMPGLGMLGDVTLTGTETPIVEGFSRVEITADNKDQFGWVQQSGLCPCILDFSAGVPGPGDLVMITGGGLVTKFVVPDLGATVNAATVNAVIRNLEKAVTGIIGRCYSGPLGGSNDAMILVDLDIYSAVSFREDERTTPLKNYRPPVT